MHASGGYRRKSATKGNVRVHGRFGKSGPISPRLPAIETTRILDNGSKRASYTYRLFGIPFTGEVCSVNHELPEMITFEMIGDIEGYIRWELEKTADCTRVAYTAEYDFEVLACILWAVRPALHWFS